MYIIRNLIIFPLFIFLICSCSQSAPFADTSQHVFSNLNTGKEQLGLMLDSLNQSTLSPRTVKNGHIKLVKSSDWTSGFFAGNLWMMYEYTRDKKWAEAADYYSENIEKEKYNAGTHDMGFKLFCSFGNGYRLTQNKKYRDILIQGAKTLCKRFNPVVGCIRSWDHNADKWDYPVIIDNMINLELLFWATRETGDSSFYHIAYSHALKTMQNHFRDDYSSWHVVSYDTLTGRPVKKNTHQGYSDKSAWARGQAWGLYGFTMAYRETGDKKFLDQAKNIAEFILNNPHLPADGVPYWDFDAPGIPLEPRDASAAAVISSALYELSMYCPPEQQSRYFAAADRILKTLSSDEYLAQKGENNCFLLKHSVGSKPANSEVDKPIIYADYYFLEANLRRMKITGSWKETKPAVIIKADDLVYDKKHTVNNRWQQFADFAVQENIHVAPGIVGSSLERGDQAFFDWIKKYNDTGLFEFWNHGQLHKRTVIDGKRTSEFFNRTVAEQAAYLKQTQELAAENLGFKFNTFGAPYNWCDENTAPALAEFPEIKVWLYAPQGTKTDKLTIERVPMLNIEYPVHNASFYPFFNNFYFYSNQSVVAIQGHPSSWNKQRMEQYKMIVHYLKNIGVKLVKPTELLQN